MYVTRHAKKRLHEREGTKKSAVNRKALLVLERGHRLSDMKGRLRRWAEGKNDRADNADNPIVYGDKLYIFTGEKLITVFQIPHSIVKNIRMYIKGGRKCKVIRRYDRYEEDDLWTGW